MSRIDHPSGLSFQRNEDDSLTVSTPGPDKAPAIHVKDLAQVLRDLGLIHGVVMPPTDDGGTPTPTDTTTPELGQESMPEAMNRTKAKAKKTATAGKDD